MLYIVIVNWNTGDKLAACLKSIAQLPERREIRKIYVVDNQSADSSFGLAQQISIDIPIEYIPLSKNHGFARANNIALHEIAQNPEHTLLLNPDTEVQPGAITALLENMAQNPNAGIMGPQLLNYSDHSLQPSVRTFPNTWVLIWLFLKLHRLFPQVPWWKHYMQEYFNYYRPQRVDQVMGAAFLIRDSLINKKNPRYIGFLDEAFWIWFEEVDYCRRAKKKNWEIWYIPQATVIHHGALSFNQLVGWKRTAPFLNSALVYAHKHLSIFGHLMLCILWPFAALLSVPASVVHMFNKYKNKKRLYA